MTARVDNGTSWRLLEREPHEAATVGSRGTRRMTSLDLVRALTAALRTAVSAEKALEAALEMLCERVPAPAGMAWARDAADQWRLLATHGEEALISPVLAPPQPEGHGPATLSSGPAGHGSVLVPVRSIDGETIAALWLAGWPEELPRGELLALLDAVAEVLGDVLGNLAARKRFHQAQQAARIGNWEWRARTDEVLFSDQMYTNFGLEPDSLEHTVAGFMARVHPADRDELTQRVQTVMAEGGPFHVVHRVITDDGETRWIEGYAQVAFDDDGTAVRLWGTSQDITERQRLEQELAHRAEHDDLTGLANRTAFEHHLQQAGRNADVADTVVVALVDIDGFREVNDCFGWVGGDRLLQEVAGRLRRAVPDAVVAARLGADDFAVLLTCAEGGRDLEALGQRLATIVEAPEPLSAQGRRVSVRVGVAANHGGGESGDDLVRAAGVALEVSRTRTEVPWQVYDPVKHGQALQRLAMEADLRYAVEHDGIGLAYQPIVAADSGEIVGVEALARWHRPGHGPVSPAVFVPLAERAGLVRQLGAQVLEQACLQLGAWQEQYLRARGWKVAVNLSAMQLDDDGLIQCVEGALDRSGLGYDRLMLEVTETALASDSPGALGRLFELRRRGVRMAIDDFGAGYSSLSRLREMPFDVLKIDRSFVQSVTSRNAPSPILQALFSIARSLALDVVAEGVETPVQLAALTDHDCHCVQGFLFSRPVSPSDLEPLLAGDPPWDIAGIIADVPSPLSSPQLQQLLAGIGAQAAPTDNEVHKVLESLADLLDLDSVYLTRVDLREGIQKVLAAANTGSPKIDAGQQMAWPNTLCWRALAGNRQVIADVPAEYSDTDTNVPEPSGVATYVGVEVPGPKGGLRGTLCGVTGTRAEIPQETVETLQWVAQLLKDFISS